ncbi:MAG TPA: hypothetical protein VFP84_12795 [Kofleriaceae bacterium]|nr:hypothetical protein [Kofleriaceae bacterium]
MCGEMVVLSALAAVSGCAVDAPASTGDELTAVEGSSVVHLQPVRAASKVADVAPPGAHLTYWGGPLLGTVHVSPIYWNSAVQFQSTLSLFYNDVPNSPLYTLLGQYGVGHGSGVPGIVGANTTRNILDADVRNEVLSEINQGRVAPPNDPNAYYPVHLAPGMQVTAPDGSRSCVQFCAYHGTFQVQNSAGTLFNVNYGVLPDLSGACNGICGANPAVVNNTTSVASHELIEATTDPAVGLATTFGPPLGWYDPNNGEIGDICNAQQGTTTGNGRSYVIQLEFSNAVNNCVAQ